MSEVAVYISLATSVASLFAWLYTLGFKIGAMDTKVNTLWEIYVKDALSEARRPHGNPKLIEVSKLFTSTLKLQIGKIALCNSPRKSPSDSDLVVKIEKQLGRELERIASENKLPYRIVIGTALLMAKDTNSKIA